MSGIRWGVVVLVGLLAGSGAWWIWTIAHHSYEDHRQEHLVRERVEALWDLELRRAQQAQPSTVAPGAP